MEMNTNSYEYVQKLIDDAMTKKDRYVTLFIGPEAVTVSVFPLTEEE